jgi:hypothetical protein
MTEAQERQPDLVELLGWPEGAQFTFMDEPGEHDPCYVVLPNGAMLALNHDCREGVDIARAHWIVGACNARLAALDEAARMRERVEKLEAALRNIEGEELSSVCRALARASLSSPVKES